jgi:hypothetical protein
MQSKSTIKYSCILIIFIMSCGHNSVKTSNSNSQYHDTTLEMKDSLPAFRNSTGTPKSSDNGHNRGKVTLKENKTVQVEIIKLNLRDTCHKMSFFHNDLKYYYEDSLYCELLYKLREVEEAAKRVSPEGDYVSMMIDDRPHGTTSYYQIALYKIRAKLDKMDRIDSYRINTKSKTVEKRDVVKDTWVAVK